MITKGDVRDTSKYIRELLRQVDKALASDDLEDAQELANELVAAASVFDCWVIEQRERH